MMGGLSAVVWTKPFQGQDDDAADPSAREEFTMNAAVTPTETVPQPQEDAIACVLTMSVRRKPVLLCIQGSGETDADQAFNRWQTRDAPRRFTQRICDSVKQSCL